MRRAILIFLVITHISEYSAIPSVNHDEKSKLNLFENSTNVGDPFYLTPLIESGSIDEARMKTLVLHDQLLNVESYSGYLTINKQYNSNTFFWYFPSQTNPKDSPVLLWLNGGPGASSLIGLFGENGPFVIKENQTVELREYSWHKTHNVIYIDNPVGVGFSFTSNSLGYARNQIDVGRDLLEGLVQFFKLFPELQKNEFYLTGESYAGKFIPSVAHAIHNYNEKTDIPFKINLKGLAIGNGLIDSFYQYKYGDFLYNIGLVDINGRDKLKKIEAEMRDLLEQKKYTEATIMSDRILLNMFTQSPSVFESLTGYTDYQSILVNRNDESHYYVGFLKRPDVLKALHVGNTPFLRLNSNVTEDFKADITQSVAPIFADLIQHYRVLIYHGQMDVIVPYIGTQDLIRNLDWAGVEEFMKAERKQWWVGRELAGYYKSFENLSEVLVRNAGHLVPADQPKWAYELITRFTHDEAL